MIDATKILDEMADNAWEEGRKARRAAIKADEVASMAAGRAKRLHKEADQIVQKGQAVIAAVAAYKEAVS